MAPYQNVFQRYEKKYMITDQQFQKLRQQITGYMKKDRNDWHTIANLYYDTDSYELIRTSIEKPIYKEKLRLRSYGISQPDSPAYLEIKKKYQGVVYKRRVQLSLETAQNYLLRGEPPALSCQILSEIDWFIQRYHPSPKVFIAYERLALTGREDDTLRITFDQNIRFRESQLDLTKGNWGTPLLEPGRILMEVKAAGAFPLWLTQILTEHRIFPTSFSKYGTCYQQHLIYQSYKKGGNICA